MHDIWRKAWREQADDTREQGDVDVTVTMRDPETGEQVDLATGEPVETYDDDELEETDDPQVKIAPDAREIYQMKFPDGSTGR